MGCDVFEITVETVKECSQMYDKQTTHWSPKLMKTSIQNIHRVREIRAEVLGENDGKQAQPHGIWRGSTLHEFTGFHFFCISNEHECQQLFLRHFYKTGLSYFVEE